MPLSELVCSHWQWCVGQPLWHCTRQTHHCHPHELWQCHKQGHVQPHHLPCTAHWSVWRWHIHCCDWWGNINKTGKWNVNTYIMFLSLSSFLRVSSVVRKELKIIGLILENFNLRKIWKGLKQKSWRMAWTL